MPKKLVWKIMSKLNFSNNSEFKDWVSSSLNAIITHNNSVTCTCCYDLDKHHNMNYILLMCNKASCNSEDHLCDVKYIIIRC